MKKLLSSILLLLTVLSFSSCSSDGEKDNTPSKSKIESLIIGKWVVAKHKAIFSYGKWYDTDGKMTLNFKKGGEMETIGTSEYILTQEGKEKMRYDITEFNGCYQWSVGDIKTKDGMTEFYFPMYYKSGNKDSYRGWHAQLQSNGDIIIEWTSTQIVYLLQKVNN